MNAPLNPPGTRLIINADDFGLTVGVNRAVLDLATGGALTSTTLMATASETAAAAQAALQQPALGVGCHIVLVDGAPVLDSAKIPTLLGPKNRSKPDAPAFRPTLGAFVFDLVRGRIREAEIEAEALAQIARLRQLGVQPTHLDTHKHTHMFPQALRPLLRAALQSNVPSIRNPFEPAWSLAANPGAGRLRRIQVRLLRTQRKTFLAAVSHSGLTTTDGAIGVLATGSLDAPALRALLAAMPPGTWELVCHPGHRDAALDLVRTRLLQSREIEREALLETIPDFAARHPSVALVNFGQLPGGSS